MRRFRSTGHHQTIEGSFVGVQFTDGTTVIRFSSVQRDGTFTYPVVYEGGIPLELQARVIWTDGPAHTALGYDDGLRTAKLAAERAWRLSFGPIADMIRRVAEPYHRRVIDAIEALVP